MAGKIILSIVLVIIVIVLIFVLVWGIFATQVATSWINAWGPGNWIPDIVSVGNNNEADSVVKVDGAGVSIGGWRIGPSKLGDDAVYAQEYERQASGVGKVVLDFADEEIEVTRGTGSAIRVEQVSAQALSEKDIMRVGMAGDTLIAESGSYRGGIQIGYRPHSTIRLYIPDGVEVKVELGTASGRISVADCAFKGLELSTASGGIDVRNVTATTIDADTSSGAVTAADIACDSFEANTTSGRVEVSGDAAKKFEANTTSGSIAYAGNTQSFGADTVSGTVSADIPAGLEKGDVNTTSGSVTLVCGAAGDLKKIKVDTISGSVRLTLPDNNGFTLNFDTISGGLDCDFEMRMKSGDKYENGDGKIDLDVNTTSGSLTVARG